MAAKSTRSNIVLRALKLAGRNVELKSLAEQLLNDLLRSWAFESRHHALRKVGIPISLAQGASTVSLPSDFGYGMESLLFGADKTELVEKDMAEFVRLGGFPGSNTSSGAPTFYTVDKNAGVVQFNSVSDAVYSILPIYYSVPDPITEGSGGDNANPWFDDDATLIQGLVLLIYQFTGDVRERDQEAKVERMKAAFKRGAAPMAGGGSRLKLARGVFK
jgi:hypothetical protein